MMKCGPPEQAVIPSIAHSGGKVKGGGGCEQSRKLRISVTRIENGPAPFSNMAWFLL